MYFFSEPKYLKKIGFDNENTITGERAYMVLNGSARGQRAPAIAKG